jgi:predicted small lipoprotein YifL
VVLVLLPILAACGVKGPLTRVPPDDSMTAEQARAQRAQDEIDTEAGLRLPPEARPIRQDDVLATTRDRATDPFDLPPP